MNNELKVTREAVLAAVETDPRSKPMLEKLFPEAFKPVWKKMEAFEPLRKGGRTVIEHASLDRKDADIFIASAFKLVPTDHVCYYRLEQR